MWDCNEGVDFMICPLGIFCQAKAVQKLTMLDLNLDN